MRTLFASLLLLLWLTPSLTKSASAQNLPADPPAPYAGPAATQEQKDRRAALYKYVYGLLCEKEDRLLEALTAFEEAVKLDPRNAAAYKAQVPLLLLLDRPRDALAAVQKTLEFDATDHESWFLAARLHKGLGETKEYRAALDKGLAVPGLVEGQPHIAQQLFYDLGLYHETAGSIDDAIAAYVKSAKILEHPDILLEHGPFLRESIVVKCAETYEKIGDLARKQKKYDVAIDAYRTAQKRLPENANRLNLHVAKLYQDVNQPAEALKAIEAYLALQPQGTEAYQIKIDLLKKLGREGETIAWLQGASKNDALNVTLKVLLANQYAQRKMTALAEATFEALAEDSPSEDVYRGLFKLERPQQGAYMLRQLETAVSLATKKPGEAGTLRAVEQARAILAVLKDDAVLAKVLVDAAYQPEAAKANLHYETRTLLAMLAEKYGKLPQAEAFYRRAIDAPGQINEAPLYAGLLNILWKTRNFEEILKVSARGLKTTQFTNPQLFYNHQARAYARLGQFPQAEATAKLAVDNAGDRERFRALNLQVRILTQAEKFVQAEAICKKLIDETTAPGDLADARYLLSSVYSGWKKTEASEAQLQEILKLDPSNPTANNDLGYLWADQNKNLKAAEEMIRKAIELDRQQRKTDTDDKDNAAYVDSLGWVLFRRGDLAGAVREMERAVALPDGDEPTLWDHLGDIYARMGRLVQAQSAYERAIHLFEEDRVQPRDERYRDTLRKLDQVKTQVRSK